MNPESKDFDSLQRLLALKRYEQPPPGYFDRFNRDVMARIKAGEKGGVVGIESSSWFQRMLSLFDVKPIFAGAFGTAVCAFVISGVISERAPAVATTSPGPISPSVATVVPMDATPAVDVSPSPVAAQVVAAGTNSGSLFEQFSLQPRQVSDRFYFPNN